MVNPDPVPDPNRNPKRFPTDDDGNPSSMRLMSMLALVVAAVLAFIQVAEWGSDADKTELARISHQGGRHGIRIHGKGS